MPMNEHTKAERQSETNKLDLLVTAYSKQFSSLENRMAHLLYFLLAFPNSDGLSRVPYAIYFAPDGFGQRQNIVNGAISQWLKEHPIHGIEFQAEWDWINDRLNGIRSVRNLLAHGSVSTVNVGGAEHIRVVPPAHDPRTVEPAAKGKLPGKSAEELLLANKVLAGVSDCVMQFCFAIEAHAKDASVLQERLDTLVKCREAVQSLYGAHSPASD